jgi:hypothetical protein
MEVSLYNNLMAMIKMISVLFVSIVLIQGTSISACAYGFTKSDETIQFRHSTIDTIPFSIYANNGWSLYSSPLVKQIATDSVEVELVLTHANNLKWNTEQLIGNMSSRKFFPINEQEYTFYLLKDNYWIVRVATNGECFIKQANGNAPISDPVILPIRARFKFN